MNECSFIILNFRGCLKIAAFVLVRGGVKNSTYRSAVSTPQGKFFVPTPQMQAKQAIFKQALKDRALKLNGISLF